MRDAASSESPPIAGPVLDALRRYWGYAALRPLQAEAIEAGLTGRDSLVVLPTGGGKSICYQIPAVIAGRTDVVLSPLISLMKDQVDGLRECGYPAAALHSGQSRDAQRQIERDVLGGKHRLLFLAPERLKNDYIQGMLTRIGVRAFAIDEAHCISHWGHDFRPEYRQLAMLKERFPQASVHAYTATATQRVRDDIVAQLGLREPTVLVGTFDRPNLIFRVVPKDDVYRQTADVLRRHEKQAAIVYCISRRETEEMAEYLRSVRVRAAHYHAGMDADARRQTQDGFAEEKLDVVVATVAFGMGIDRSDVRCVIHAGMPKTIEHYQQETGRAGRDGLPAECVLFYSYADVAKWEGLIERSAEGAESPEEVIGAMKALLREMGRLCSGFACRHKGISEYFGQPYPRPSCEACDICLGEAGDFEDATVSAQKVLSCVARCGERYGVGHIVEVLVGSKSARIAELRHDQLSTYGLMKDLDKKAVQRLTYQLLDQGLLEREGAEYPIVKLNAASWEVMRGKRQVKLPKAPVVVRQAKVETESWEGVDRGLFEELRALRLKLAQERGVPAYVILHDTVLRDLARFRPTSARVLSRIKGFGSAKRKQYGETVVACIREYARAHSVGTDVLELDGVLDVGPPLKEPKINAAKSRAFELFARGERVESVAEEICRAHSTVWQWLAEFAGTFQLDDVTPWVDEATFQRVAEAWRVAANDGHLKPIHDQLGGAVPYEVIRLVARHMERTVEQAG